jgi:hypothetical protein
MYKSKGQPYLAPKHDLHDKWLLIPMTGSKKTTNGILPEWLKIS